MRLMQSKTALNALSTRIVSSMSVYRYRRRNLLPTSDKAFEFPAVCTIHIHLNASTFFGTGKGGGHISSGFPTKMFFDGSTGQLSVRDTSPAVPLSLAFSTETGDYNLNGSTITLKGRFECEDSIKATLNSLYIHLPTTFNLHIIEPVFIKSIRGHIGDAPFHWDLREMSGDFNLSNLEERKESVVSAIQLAETLAVDTNPRLAAGLRYFHVASRLAFVENTPAEFMPECILNLAKSLEALFVHRGIGELKGKPREIVRHELLKLDYSKDEMESWIMPALIIRDELDVAHASFAELDEPTARIIQEYARNAVAYFRRLFSRIIERSKSGTYALPNHDGSSPLKALAIAETLAKHSIRKKLRGDGS